MVFWLLMVPGESPSPAWAIISTVTSPRWVLTGEITQKPEDHQQRTFGRFHTRNGGRVMQTRVVVRPDGKGGEHFVEVGLRTPQLQYAPAMVSGITSYRSLGQGEVIQSQTPHLQSDGPTQIDNGEAMTRSPEWSQPQPSESGHHDIEPDPAERRAEAVPTPPVRDQTGKSESTGASSTALEVGHAPEVERMVDHTLADLDDFARRGWYWFRNAQLYALHACVLLLRFAEAHEREFRAYCGKAFGQDAATVTEIDPARASIESLAFALQVRQDPKARNLKRAHRAGCANAIGWFAHLCVETDPNKAVELARSLGGIAGIAARYRKDKDEKDPSRQERTAKAKATRGARMNQSDVPPSAMPVSDVPTEGSAAETESLSAASIAVALATSALNSSDNQEATQLLDHLKQNAGIRPLVNLVVPAQNQKIVVLLQVGDTIFGPIRDKSISATVVAQLVTEHLQQELPQDGLATTNTV
jgi:hypothetical protein